MIKKGHKQDVQAMEIINCTLVHAMYIVCCTGHVYCTFNIIFLVYRITFKKKNMFTNYSALKDTLYKRLSMFRKEVKIVWKFLFEKI